MLINLFTGEHAWFYFTLLSTLIYGIINFMYKVAAVHNCSSQKIVNVSAGSISLMSLSLILLFDYPFFNLKMILFFALINSTFFALGSIAKISSLKRIPTSIAFPITKFNAVLLIVYGLILFDEQPKVNQWIGIGISIGMLAYISLTSSKGKNGQLTKAESKNEWIGIGLAFFAAVATSVSMLTGKYASSAVPKINYVFISYTLVFIYTTVINKWLTKKRKHIRKPEGCKKTLLFGIIIGVLNFAGYLCVLSAFETGPLSLIQGISSNAFVIPILLSIIVYKEKFGLKNFIIVLLAIITIIIIKL